MEIELLTSPGLGDAPALAIIEKNWNSRLKRKTEETSKELEKISNRVDQTLYDYENLTDFESRNQLTRNNSIISHCGSIDSTLEFVDDMSQLSTLLSDPVMKRKYQQSVAIFVVGYESLCGNRLQLLSQINDSLYSYKNQQVPELEDSEFDVDHVGRSVRKAINKAVDAQTKLKDIGQNVATVLNKLNLERRKYSKKKTEKELVQTKEQILSITEKLIEAQEEVGYVNEKIDDAYRNLEIKQVEIERLKTQIEASKKRSQDADVLRITLDEKDKEIHELIKENDKLGLVVTKHKEKQEHLEQAFEESKSKQRKLEKHSKIHEQLIEQQAMTVKRETEKFYENQLEELRRNSESILDEEKVISKKKLASMDATIRGLRADLTKLAKSKEDAINNILTQQAQKEVSEQNNQFNDSVERVVKYEKELKASHDKNKELENKLKEEDEKKKSKKKKEKTKTLMHQDSTVLVETKSTGVQSELPVSHSSSNDDEGQSVGTVGKSVSEEMSTASFDDLLSELADVKSKELKSSHEKLKEDDEKKKLKKKKEKTKTFKHQVSMVGVQSELSKFVNEEVSIAPSGELLSELAEVKSKYNQKLLLVAKLIEGQDKFVKERGELLEQVEMATNVKEDIEKELQTAMEELGKVRLLYEQENMRNFTTKEVETKIDTTDSGVMTSPIPTEEKPRRNSRSAQTYYCDDEKPKYSLNDDDDNGNENSLRLSSAAAAKSRASSVSSTARYRILESCLRSHPMVVNIRESYDNILQLKDEVAEMLESEEDCKDCEQIVKQIPLEEIREEDAGNGNMADMILKMAVNSTRVLTTLQQVIPLFIGRDDILYYNQSTDTTPALDCVDKPPESSISIHVVNRSTTISLPPVKDQDTQQSAASSGTNNRHIASVNSGRLAEDYKALVYKHNDLEQDFVKLKKQFESYNRAHEHILSNNTSTIQEMEATIADLRTQLKETSRTAYKDEEFIFTRADVEYNERTLRQGLRVDQVEEDTMEETKAAMKEYISIPVQRWGHLVRTYLHQVHMTSIQKILRKSSEKSPQYDLRVIFSQMQLLQRKRSERHFMKSAELTRQRMWLAKMLIEGLETIESKTGVFLIKPIATLRSKSDVSIEKQSLRDGRRTQPSIPEPKILPGQYEPVLTKCVSRPHALDLPQLWKPAISSVDDEKLPCPELFDSGQLRIPRLLELDVNRTMYSENQISTSMPSNTCFKNKDNQLNLISYMTVERPGALRSLDQPASNFVDSDDCSIATSIKRPTSLPALKSRLSLVTEEALIDHYRRSVSTWNSDRERKVTQSPMIQY